MKTLKTVAALVVVGGLVVWGYVFYAEQVSLKERGAALSKESDAIITAKKTCWNLVKSRLPNPSTLQTNSSGGEQINETAGGWVVRVYGHTVDGGFDLSCYIDRSFTVTHLVQN